MRKGDKRLKYEDRKEIEKMKNDGVRVVVIAEKIGVHRATIYNELRLFCDDEIELLEE